MNQFYACANHKDLLKLLLKKGRSQQLTINILCENSFFMNDISNFLWNNSIPHFVNGDPYIDQNHIFVSDIEMPADIIICFEDCDFKNIYKCNKKYFIGKHINFSENNEKYWIESSNRKWQEITKDFFFS